jgi:hypothetical protein
VATNVDMVVLDADVVAVVHLDAGGATNVEALN